MSYLFLTLSCTFSVSSTVHITHASTQLKPDGREERRQSQTLLTGVNGIGRYSDLLLRVFRNLKVWGFFCKPSGRSTQVCRVIDNYVSWCFGLSSPACTSLSLCALLHTGKARANHIPIVLVQSGFGLAVGDHTERYKLVLFLHFGL